MEEILLRYINFINKRTFSQNNNQKFLEDRKKFIGGSENYKATNTISSKRQILKNKLGLGYKLNGKIAIEWGNMHENTTRKLSEYFLNCNIYETNGCIKHSNGVNAYSPDGLGVVKISKTVQSFIASKHGKISISKKTKQFGNYKYTDDIYDKNGIECYCLFEFKTPWSRRLNKIFKNNEYARQILVGLDTILLCNVGIFVDCDIKECTAEQHWFDREYTHYNGTSNSASYDHNPKVLGCSLLIPLNESAVNIGQFFMNKFIPEDQPELMPNEDFILLQCPIFTLTGIHEFKFIQELEKLNVSEDIIEQIRILIILAQTVEQINQEIINDFYSQLYELLQDYVVGYEYWKLMEIYFYLFPKIPGLVDLWEDDCRELIEFIESNDGLEPEQQLENISKFYSQF